jgi:hypothetical protein
LKNEDIAEDVPFLLYLFPTLASIVYGILEWYVIGGGFKSWSMPVNAFITVSKSQYLFLGSISAILIAIYVEVRLSGKERAFKIITDNSRRLEWLALITLVISFAASESVASYSPDLSVAAVYFMEGRYALIFSLFLILIAFLIMPATTMEFKEMVRPRELASLAILVISPFVYFLGYRFGYGIPAAGVSILLVALGGSSLYFALRPKREEPKKIPKPAEIPAR